MPALAATYAGRVLDAALHGRGIAREDIACWIWHAGGKRVLAALESELELAPETTALSRAVLAAHGNLSSAFVYLVLQQACREHRAPGWWWLSSFGAGFSCHGALLRAQPA